MIIIEVSLETNLLGEKGENREPVTVGLKPGVSDCSRHNHCTAVVASWLPEALRKEDGHRRPDYQQLEKVNVISITCTAPTATPFLERL